MKLDKDLREFVALLNSLNVEYLVVGGHAVAFHGYARLTDDLDLLLRHGAENAGRTVEALKAFGFASIGLTASDFLAPDRVIQLGRAPNRIDLLTKLYGVDSETAWRRRVKASLDGLDVAIIAREDLIANKRATGRTQDLADAEYLERSNSTDP